MKEPKPGPMWGQSNTLSLVISPSRFCQITSNYSWTLLAIFFDSQQRGNYRVAPRHDSHFGRISPGNMTLIFTFKISQGPITSFFSNNIQDCSGSWNKNQGFNNPQFPNICFLLIVTIQKFMLNYSAICLISFTTVFILWVKSHTENNIYII